MSESRKKNDILIEDLILSNLISNDEYSRKVLSFLQSEYFSEFKHKTIYNLISEYVEKYNKRPTIDSLKIELQKVENINENNYYDVLEYIAEIDKEPEKNLVWLLERTEEFGNDQAVHNAFLASLSILDGSDKKHDKGMIPKLVLDALSVSLDNSVGHDYLEDAEERYDFLHSKEEKVPFDLQQLNIITKGGVSKKTLNLLMAGINVGKSLAMCHMAAANLVAGFNVLYITLEMAKERISERIDMNLLNATTDELFLMSKAEYLSKIKGLKSKILGKLVVEEYAPTTASASHFRSLLNELKIKKQFVPDIIYIDYLNICASARVKIGTNVNSYSYLKAVSEELRGLGFEFDVPVISAIQLNRTGFNSQDLSMTDVAESFAISAAADFIIALSVDEELEKLHQIMIKQIKTRYGSKAQNKRFVVGIDYEHMRLYDVDDAPDLTDLNNENSSIFDKTNFGLAEGDRFKDLF